MEDEILNNEILEDDDTEDVEPSICDCGECKDCIEREGECNCGDCDICKKKFNEDDEDIDTEDLYDDVETEDLM